MSIWIQQSETGKGITYKYGGTTYNYVWNGHSFWPSFQDQGFPNGNFDWGTYNTTGTTSSFNLSGFQVGNEAVLYLLEIRWDAGYSGYVEIECFDPDGTVVYNAVYSGFPDPGPGSTAAKAIWAAIGVRPKPWPEIWSNSSNYRWVVTGIVSSTRYFTTYNLDLNVMYRYYNREGHVWVSGEYLWYMSSIGCKHYIRHDGNWHGFPGTSKSGYVWIDDSEYKICWVDETGYTRKCKRGDKYWITGWTGYSVNVGSSNKGYFWVSENPYWTKVQFVAYDGYLIRVGPGYTGAADMQ